MQVSMFSLVENLGFVSDKAHFYRDFDRFMDSVSDHHSGFPSQPTSKSDCDSTFISVESLTFTYPNASQPALIDVDFKVSRGQTVAIVGSNYIGKAFDSQQMLDVRFDGIELSGGLSQRTAIARAALRDKADIVFLDEPTSAIDPMHEAFLHEQLLSLARSKTSFIVTHRLPLTFTADLILVLDKGRIVESGTFEQLRNGGGPYQSMFRTQQRLHEAT